jgi:predicted DNA-binding transcriptional regulator YafY
MKGITVGNRYNRRGDRYAILNRIANDPDLTAAEAARLFYVSRHTVERWCREAGIPLIGHKAPRVGFVLSIKKRRWKRLTQELAKLNHEIRALEELDPAAPYVKPRKSKK